MVSQLQDTDQRFPTGAYMARLLEQDGYHIGSGMPGYPGSMRMFLVMASLSVFLVLPACAQLCGDTGTREGAWGLVFRCSTGSRMQIDNAASGIIGVSGTRKQSGPADQKLPQSILIASVTPVIHPDFAGAGTRGAFSGRRSGSWDSGYGCKRP